MAHSFTHKDFIVLINFEISVLIHSLSDPIAPGFLDFESPSAKSISFGKFSRFGLQI